MEVYQRPPKLRSANEYFIESLKFYKLKNEHVSRTIFILTLLISFGGAFIPISHDITTINTKDAIVYIAEVIIMQLAYSIYLLAYIKELKGEDYNLSGCFMTVMANSFKIIGALIIYIAAVMIGTFVLVIPGIIVGIMFVFSICYIVDQKNSIFSALKASKDVSKGYKLQLFIIWLMFFSLLIMLISFVMVISNTTNNAMVFVFVLSFIGTITNLMQQRLTALLYYDLQYK